MVENVSLKIDPGMNNGFPWLLLLVLSVGIAGWTLRYERSAAFPRCSAGGGVGHDDFSLELCVLGSRSNSSKVFHRRLNVLEDVFGVG